MNQCKKQLHRFEGSTVHDYNQNAGIGGNCNGFPYGHTCLCGEKTHEEPELDGVIRKGTMIDKILISRIESGSNQLVESRGRLLISG